MPEHIQVSDSEIYIEGWALSLWNQPEQTRLLINGQDIDKIEWPIESPDIATHFDTLPNTKAARFRCRHTLEKGKSPYLNGFIRFNVTGPYGEHRLSYRTAWFFCDPDREFAVPSPAQRERVIGTDHLEFFKIGGATIVNRIQLLLQERFDRTFSNFNSILDWGCGAGRLTRYLPFFTSSITAVDIDPDNIRGCKESIPGVDFLQTELHPPTPFGNASFDLVIGLSVLTHLREPVQNAWLAELQRIVCPGGLVLLSIQGMAQSALYRTPIERCLAVRSEGILYVGNNSQLDQVIDAPDYYVDVIHSHDYVMTKWGNYFDVLEIVEAIAGNQDLVVMRRR
ncbi:Methyltransferase domain-containing protein [Pseudomonas pohangensis]|uniref:Methyltransferase domain-containing protein n=2 Tax=Pseudomonas pohangensis TaxID=364197 RepID=A0A1H2EFF3_9PSED|nr:Methyltransferase domain-containing protein [Pseudomonas pohangensis]